MNFYAKREVIDDDVFFQTLEGHTIDALLILKEYVKEYHQFLGSFCKNWGIEKDKLLRNLFYTVYLHDIGKLTKEFQNNLSEGRHSAEYPHAYYSIFILQKFENFEPVIDGIPLEFAAVMGHHTQLHKNIYSLIEKTPSVIREGIEQFINNMEEIYYKLGFDSFFEFKRLYLKGNAFKLLSLSKMRKERDTFIKGIVRKYLDDTVPLKDNAMIIKAVYSLILSALQISDNYSSLNFKETIKNMKDDSSKIGSAFLSTFSAYGPEKYVLKLPDNGNEIIKQGKNLRKFQAEAESIDKKAIFLFAPCGRGKTEASLLWAFSSSKKYGKNKIVFALPTQVTCNLMYQRLKKQFGEENVALYHGKSLIKLKDEYSKEFEYADKSTVDIDEISSENFRGKVFFKPITVTTIDHVILSFIHGFSQSDFSLGNLLNSCVIFDEIHYYDRVTMGHLFDLFPLMNTLDVPHLLMSGTLPEFLTEKFTDYEIICDNDGLKYQPFKVKYHDEMLVWKEGREWNINESIIEEIAEKYKQGYTQFVILNTVERAKQFYKAAKGKKISAILYHSQFTYKDRVSKENEILRLENERKKTKKPYILIATQVIEVSLDISADIMYSEVAPADALGQRGGRLNRGGEQWKKEKKKYMMHIFKPETFRPYSEDIIEKTSVVLNTFDNTPLSYMDIKTMCDSIYFDYQAKNSSFEEYFFHSIIFGHKPSELCTKDEEGKNFSTRDENFVYINVIPCSIYKKLGEKAFSMEHLVKIPYYVYKNNSDNFEIKEYKKDLFVIAKYYYDPETGFYFNIEEKCTKSNIL